MNKIKITVAIPIYNTGNHLRVALDSLLHQTMDAAAFEVICVNDCSTDNSKEVIQEYQKKMSNLVLIDREKNSGAPSIPRNDAIDAARGEYIFFMDSDDFLGEETLERFCRAAKQYQSDVLLGKLIGVNGRCVPQTPFAKGNRPRADILTDNLVYSIGPTKVFRLSFLREHGFKFHPDVVGGNEDLLFVMQSYVTAKVITVLSDYPYYFVIARGDENLSVKYFPAEVWFYVYYHLMDFLDKAVPDEDYRRKIKVAYLTRLLQYDRLRGHLLNPGLTREQKQEWLKATKRFIDAHLDDKIINSMSATLRQFLQVAKENNMQRLAEVPM